jgi:cyclopropane-fatty-acyl-phospholipid synthase
MPERIGRSRAARRAPGARTPDCSPAIHAQKPGGLYHLRMSTASAMRQAEATTTVVAGSPPDAANTVPGSTTIGNTTDRLEAMLARADIRVLRPPRHAAARAWDVRLHDERLAPRVQREGLVGLGDAYVDGWWECTALDELFDRALSADLPASLASHPRVVLEYLNHRLRNLQNRPHARSNVHEHYDMGNDVFRATLDPYMQYTCGYWKDAADLNQAQINKLDLTCRKIGIGPGMTVRDLGCGGGGFARFAAERFGARVTGVTLSTEQLGYAREFCRNLPVEFRLHDYRDTRGTFDRVVSIGMFEHVGPKNYRTAMRVVHRCLKDDGLALIHFFATRDSFPNRTHSEVAWINKHIFPGLVVPSLKQIGDAIDGLFVLEDLHNFGADYDPTLMAWGANFERNWPSISATYGDRFYRMWRYYLYSCAGAFRAREYQLWQLVLSKHGVRGGYASIR